MSSSIAGRKALVKMSGTPTSFTDQAVNVITTNKIYQIASTTRRVWSPTATITVKAGGVAVDAGADPYAINRLTGVVTFTNVSARGTVTISGTYLPMTTIAQTKAVDYSTDRPSLDATTFDSGNWMEVIGGIGGTTVTLSRNWESVYGALLKSALESGSVLVIQIFSDRAAAADDLIWALPTKGARKAVTSGILEEDLEFVGTPDADGRSSSLA
jgi:hypothetical protein